ncbi:MATE efflux family protein (plasmid) [Natrialba magadii ATCC 43099]|uniref:Multidrug-efflux transporter n=1 Tax=Natrialba magadii (strain ATCC 43099 / DSM 3394 / CCM 3739 / CIP 104546 / IAM 13178 / JCM 8861 / NBRC 102185 / NCIMB 2190 / MS3) TaxID=547559 RepID=D3T1G8_NATMM|nr:MATE family efflux transporter [Natrialba magadii]ADD07427.1 MATE efflux family protein [Natrialba magadii ATCC 43099]ELY32235.1 MATE efflux family protein [Natrialba magadii ATCC 43099]
MTRFPNPLRLTILYIGLALARLGLIDRERAIRTTVLAWPRIITGIARMSKSAVDVAMVGVAVGTSAVAGVGFAGPFWGLAFAIGGGVAGGTIALVSQRYGAEAYEELGLAVRSSTLLVLVISLPVLGLFWTFPEEFISLITNNEAAINHGATYLQYVALGIPFAGLNLVGSRVLVGADDSYTAMQVRAGGAVLNIILSAVFIFGLDLGVAGAAAGTVLANLAVTAGFAIGLSYGTLPGVGDFPVKIDPFGSYLDPETIRNIVKIGLPVGGRNLVWVVAEFPMLGILNIFGENTVAAFVIARRIWGIMNTPGWGFGLASSSLVGQELGQNNEQLAEAYGRDIIRFAVATYIVSAIVIALFADQIVVLFADDPTSAEIPIATDLVYAACVAVVFQGVAGAAAGPLDASGDTNVPFASQFIGMFLGSIPLAYLGATTSLGYWGLYLAFIAETTIPAAINYWRFRTDKWKSISQTYRPDAAVADD